MRRTRHFGAKTPRPQVLPAHRRLRAPTPPPWCTTGGRIGLCSARASLPAPPSCTTPTFGFFDLATAARAVRAIRASGSRWAGAAAAAGGARTVRRRAVWRRVSPQPSGRIGAPMRDGGAGRGRRTPRRRGAVRAEPRDLLGGAVVCGPTRRACTGDSRATSSNHQTGQFCATRCIRAHDSRIVV